MKKTTAVFIEAFNNHVDEQRKNGTPDSPLGWQTSGPTIREVRPAYESLTLREYLNLDPTVQEDIREFHIYRNTINIVTVLNLNTTEDGYQLFRAAEHRLRDYYMRPTEDDTDLKKWNNRPCRVCGELHIC
jgi:hypothetical protein